MPKVGQKQRGVAASSERVLDVTLQLMEVNTKLSCLDELWKVGQSIGKCEPLGEIEMETTFRWQYAAWREVNADTISASGSDSLR